jgi:2-hydroxychromene-2-carboxylate isomerase
VASAAFYYDFNSPYAYLAAERLDEMVPGAEWKPIAFAILLNEQGRLQERLVNLDTAPVVEEVSRRLADRGMPDLVPPPGWPVESWSLTPLRAAVVAEEAGRHREFAVAAFRRAFVQGDSLAELDTVLDVAREAGLDPDAVGTGVSRQDIKDRLKQNTDEALARGVTGIPTVILGDQVFYGDDHLEEAAAAA